MEQRPARPARPAWRLTVHLPCLQVRGLAGDRVQGCLCAPTEKWARCDVSRAVDLCVMCARGTAGGTTRWAWLGCESCRAVEKAARAFFGVCVAPLGRHSLLNGVGLRVAEASPEEASAFAVQFEGLSLSWDRLFDWGRHEARRLADTLRAPDDDVLLDEWRHTFPASVSASVDAYERFLNMPLPTGLRVQLLPGTAER